MDIAQYQLFSAMAWGVVALFLFRPCLRALRGRPNSTDEWKSVLFFVALLMVAFPSRWLVLPGDEGTWKGLYLIAIALAVYVMLLLWNGRRK